MYPEDSNQPNSFEQQPHKESEVDKQKDLILRQILDSNALSRIGNIKMVKPDLASLVENYLIGMATQGKIQGKITDEQLKQILLSIQQPKREFKINHR